MIDCTTRREPTVTFSRAITVCRWPRRHSGDATIALIYDDRDRLHDDYDRVAQWKRLPGLAALVPTAHLERSPGRPGLPYVDFGWRRYLSKGAKRRFEELPVERIAVQVAAGGKNRGSVIKALGRTEELFVVFSQVVSLSDTDELDRQVKNLFSDRLVAFGDTEPISLRGLTIFGRFVPTRNWKEIRMRN